jgi:hypothetical protein
MADMRSWFERAEAERKKQPKVIRLTIGMDVCHYTRTTMAGMRPWADERKVWNAED